MDPILRQKALAAAASVVLALGAGCGPVEADLGPVDSASYADTDAVDTDVSDTDAVDTDAVDTDAPDCTVAADVMACCETLRTWCEGAHADDAAAIDACIFGPNYDGSTGCIPWGPPTPPEATAYA